MSWWDKIGKWFGEASPDGMLTGWPPIPLPLPPAPPRPLPPGVTTDPTHPEVKYGVDAVPREQNLVYLVLPQSERDKGYMRPVRTTYVHDFCGTRTSMGRHIAETYARNPKFYGSTYCVRCMRHLPVNEFHWLDGEVVGS